MSKQTKNEMYFTYEATVIVALCQKYELSFKERVLLEVIYSFARGKRPFTMSNATIAREIYGEKPDLYGRNFVSRTISSMVKKGVIVTEHENPDKKNSERININLTDSGESIKQLVELFQIETEVLKNIERGKKLEEKKNFIQNQQTELLVEEPILDVGVDDTDTDDANGYYDELADSYVNNEDVIVEEHIAFKLHEPPNILNENSTKVVTPVTNSLSVNEIQDDDLPF